MTLFGRRDQLTHGRAMMEQPVRLLTVSAPPGVGNVSFVQHSVAKDAATTVVSLAKVDDREPLDGAVASVLERVGSGWVVLDGLDARLAGHPFEMAHHRW